MLNDKTLLAVNGRKVGDTMGKRKCHKHNGSSTVDLSIVSSELYHKINYFNVLGPVWFSDHCLIIFFIKSDQLLFEEKIDHSEFKELEHKFVWSAEGGLKFSRKLKSKVI